MSELNFEDAATPTTLKIDKQFTLIYLNETNTFAKCMTYQTQLLKILLSVIFI